MAHFFLVSGSEGQESHWRACVNWLQVQGHQATALGWTDLPWHDGLEGVLDFLRKQIEKADTPVLVGHSAGGLLVSRLSPEKAVLGEVYLAALAPQPGLSFAEQMFESPMDVFSEEWLASAYPASSEEAIVLRNLYEAPFAGYVERPRLYLAFLADREIRPEWQAWIASQIPRAEVLSLKNAGHYAHVHRAEEVGMAIANFAQAYYAKSTHGVLR